MKKTKITLGLIAHAVLLIISFHSHATVWRVNNAPLNHFIQSPALNGSPCSHCFSDLQVAINSLSVNNYDTLHVEASPYSYETITINRPLTLIGAGYFLQQNQNSGLQFNPQVSIVQAIVVDTGAHGSVFEGLYISDGGAGIHDVRVFSGDITIKRCAFGAITFYNNLYNMSDITITQCYGGDIGQSNAQNFPIINLVITNNLLGNVTLRAGHVGLFEQNVVGGGVNGYVDMIYRNNIFATGYIVQNDNTVNNVLNNTFSVATWLTGLPGNTNESETMPNVFTTYPVLYDANLVTNMATCVTCMHGFPWPSGAGTLKGVFGGTTPYVLGGIANIPTIYNLNAFSPINQGGNTPVNISTRSNNKN